MKVVIFLQNAWSPLYAGSRWPRDSWLKALHRSRTGRRLRVLTDAAGLDFTWWYDNTTPQVSEESEGRMPEDLQHMGEVLETIQPRYVIGMGKQADRALARLAVVPRMLLPHPGYRVVTNFLYQEAAWRLRAGFEGVLSILQCKGGILINGEAHGQGGGPGSVGSPGSQCLLGPVYPVRGGGAGSVVAERADENPPVGRRGGRPRRPPPATMA